MRFLGFPPEHNPEQQSELEPHDWSTCASVHTTGAFVGAFVVGPKVGRGVGTSGDFVGGGVGA